MDKPVLLIVDDDPAVRDALHLVLDPAFEVLDAANGRAAIAAARAQPVHAVLLDILLPDLDGIEVLKELKTIDPAVAVVMVTAVKTVRTSVIAMQLGAADYLTKPFAEEELMTSLDLAIGRRAARMSPRRPPPPHRIVVLDGDVGRRAALVALLERIAPVETSGDGATPGGGTDSAGPSVCVVAAPGPGLKTARRLCARYPTCSVVVAVDGDDPTLGPELAFLPIHTVLRPPLEVAGIVQCVRSVLAGAGTPRSWLTSLPRPVSKTIEHVRAHYREPLHVDVLADVAGISASYLAHTFRSETGISVKSFVMRVRVEVAKALLATTDAKLSRIAREVGLCDASHLSRVLRRATGRRPSAYRQPPAQAKVS